MKKKHNTRAICLLALASLVPGTAFAGRDSYGIGTGRSGALNVTGGMPTVVNTYTTLAANAAAGATTITVGSAMGFAAGDLLMVYRANGALASVPAAPPMGMPAPAISLSASPVGRWELARVQSVAGAVLTLDEALVSAFDAAGTQVIRVPEYTTVTVAMGSTLAAQAWNGTTGGVLAFLATGAIANAGTISADSRGFRGGAYVNNSGPMGCTELEETADRGQFSGESGQTGAFGVRRGRGYLANGGGGGICHNSGGGGGGNGGRGGIGGRTWRDDGGRAMGGYGGTAFTYTLLDHASLGGGGGAGDGNNNTGTSGGIGGGLVFVRADSLTGMGAIASDGQSLGNAGASANDAQGGGGAGGSIYLRLRNNAACGSIHANGGNGGSTGFVEHGPGGGGGGGHILVQAAMRAASCTLLVNNGLAGTQGNMMATDGVNYGATPTTPTTPNIVGVTETAPPGGFVILAAPVTVTPANGSSTATRRPVLSGTAPAGSTVLVFVDGVQVGTVTADAAGNWTLTPTSDLSFGMHTVSAIANDPVQRVFSVRSNTNTFTVVMVVDTDGDGVADLTDADDDNDGVTDVAEGNGRDPSRDTDGDGVPDFRDRDFAGFVDSNMDGVDDRVDADLDGTPNQLDLDADGDGIFDVLENGNGALDANRDGRIDGNTDADRDGLLAGVDSNDANVMVITPRTTPIDSDMDGRIDALDADDDNDGVPTRAEVGAGGPYMPRNTDGAAAPGVTTDTRPDYLDTDDDGDGILTSDELGPGGAATPLNSDATVPAGQGTADANPNYLDPDDDGDSIPTSVERTLAGMTPDPDGDMLAAWLDRDSDGDTVFDIVEAGATPATPANSDMDTTRDFLDLDSDNDCVPDRDAREAGAARTNPAVPSMNVNNNCPSATPVCAIATGTCTNDRDTDMDGIPDMVETRIGTDPNNRDSDMDGIPDGSEVGAGPAFMTRDSDMDGMIDARDPDDDGDGVLTRDELGAGGFMTPRNTDAMVPMGQGTSDMVPDYLDPDDDGDGIPTRTENTLENMGGAPDMDTTPAYLDLDSDGDGIPDAIERGPDGAMPRNSDGADRPDFLDLDSDNDTVDDRTEAGATPLVPRNSNAMVPMGMGTANALPDYIDPDDDGDGIPTAVEVRLEGMTSGDTDMIPAYLDLDSDGDTVPDTIERGTNPMNPANSDPMAGMGDRPDFLDTDSDNDCVPDSDAREAGAARTNPALPSAMTSANCMAPTPICSAVLGRCVGDNDSDGDGIPNDVETRIGTDPMNPDSDMDGIPDGSEVGAGPAFMTRDSDMDGMIDARDPDDDGDGVLTRDELGAGGFMTPRNTDAMVPMGQGTSDMVPDYLDPDDDGDGIPTRTENTLENMGGAPDMDMTPAYLDLDSDGDGVFDTIEAGPTPNMPANSDGMAGAGDRPDFLDLDSDNDCVADSDMREAGAARTNPAMPAAMASNNCMAPTPICDTSVGMCVAMLPPDGGQRDASADAVVRDGASNVDGGRMDGGAITPPGVLSGDGACACRVPAAGGASGERALSAVIALGGLALVYGARRKRHAKR